MNPVLRLARAALDTAREAALLCLTLFKVMIPIIVGVKILSELDLIRYLAEPLAPVMGLMGLPGATGLVWATAMLNSIYSGIIVYLSLAQDVPLTAAQMTVLCSVLLVAHNLPVEVGIARRSGPRFLFQLAARVAGALALGMLLHHFYSAFGLLQEPARVLLSQDPARTASGASLASWALGEARNLASIAGVVLALVAVMRVLTAIRAVELINAALRPVLRMLGIGPKASAITVIGLTLGLAYGGGLIIREAQSGVVDRRDVFFSLTLMGLCHSLIEDTLLMVMLGGHLSGILWGRLAFSLLATALLVRATALLSPAFCDRHLWGRPAAAQTAA